MNPLLKRFLLLPMPFSFQLPPLNTQHSLHAVLIILSTIRYLLRLLVVFVRRLMANVLVHILPTVLYAFICPLVSINYKLQISCCLRERRDRSHFRMLKHYRMKSIPLLPRARML